MRFGLRMSGRRGGDAQQEEQKSENGTQEGWESKSDVEGWAIRDCAVHGFLLSDRDLRSSQWSFIFAMRPESAAGCCAKSRSLASLGMTIRSEGRKTTRPVLRFASPAGWRGARRRVKNDS